MYKKNQTLMILDEKMALADKKLKQLFKVDKRKRKHRVPSSHPWRQYKLSRGSSSG